MDHYKIVFIEDLASGQSFFFCDVHSTKTILDMAKMVRANSNVGITATVWLGYSRPVTSGAEGKEAETEIVQVHNNVTVGQAQTWIIQVPITLLKCTLKNRVVEASRFILLQDTGSTLQGLGNGVLLKCVMGRTAPAV